MSNMQVDRRYFSKAGVATLAVLSNILGIDKALAQNPIPIDGREFWILEKPVATTVPSGKIEVLEFFRYSCPHCFEFEPPFEAWVKRLPDKVVLKRTPISFGDNDGVLQRLYYSLEALGLVTKLHAKVFDAIHIEKIPLNTDVMVADWIKTQGVDRAAFSTLQKSFSIASKVTQAKQLEREFLIEGVPSLGIAGRYYTGGSLTHTRERALEVADYLISEIAAGRR